MSIELINLIKYKDTQIILLYTILLTKIFTYDKMCRVEDRGAVCY